MGDKPRCPVHRNRFLRGDGSCSACQAEAATAAPSAPPPAASGPQAVPDTGWLVDVEHRYRLYLAKEGQPTLEWRVEEDDVASVAAELRMAADGLEAAAKTDL